MSGIIYQLKNIRRDKLCFLTFLLPVIAGIAINFMSGFSFSSIAEVSFGILENDLSEEAAEWLQNYGSVTVYRDKVSLEAAVNDPATQMIGVLWDGGEGINTIRSGDELQMVAVMADVLPNLFTERGFVDSFPKTIVPIEQTGNFLLSLLTVITLVTAMFMGCTFNAMNIIGEKEDGIIFINEVLPMGKIQYMVQKMALGFSGGILSAAVTAALCMRVKSEMLLPLAVLIVLSSFIAALTGLFIGRFAGGLMTGIVSIKLVMIGFLAPPVVFYLYTAENSMARGMSCILPSSVTFYGLMDLLNGQMKNIGAYSGVLLAHCVLWFFLYILISAGRKRNS